MAKGTTRQISVFLNGDQVTATAKNIAGAFKESSNELAKMVVGGADYLKKLEEVKKYRGALDEHRQRLRGIEQGWSLAKTGLDKFIGVAAGAFAVDSLLSYGKQLYGVGVAMDALDKKARTVFGTSLPKVTAEAERNATAIGLTTSQYINAAAAIQDILVPMGFQRDRAADISTQLINLSGALSEWTGGQVTSTQVADILSSALTGEREQLKQLGIVLSQADIDARLADKGLSALTGTMRQQAEAAATLELIMEKSTDAQAGFAAGADSAVRRQAELAAKTQEVTEKLATLLLPVFEALAAVAGTVVGAIGDVVGLFDDMINPAKAASQAFDEQAKKVSGLNTEIVPLLDRYDELTGKTTLTAAEQVELKSIVEQVSGVIPSAVSGFNAYGEALGLNTAAARDFIEVERARLKFVNEAAIQETQTLKSQLEEEAKLLQGRLKLRTKVVSGASASGFGTQLNTVGLTNEEIGQAAAALGQLQERVVGVNAELARLRGENLNIPTPAAITPAGGGNGGGGNKDGKKKKVEELAPTPEEEAEIVERYKTTFAAIQAQRELFRGITAELSQQFLDQQQTELETTAQTVASKIDLDLNYELEKADAREVIRESLLTDQEAEIEALNNHYLGLLSLADQYGLDTTALREKQAAELAAIDKKYADQTVAAQQEANQQRLQAYGQLFGEFANIATAGADLIGAEGEKSAEFQKIATLAKIAFDTAAAISSLTAASSANPANAVTFGGAGILQYAAGLARILTAIGQAKKILQGAPKVQQKFMGGELPVTGATDGRQYNARYISTPSTGLLPHFPVLFNSNATGRPVLASERGREYFVSAEALRNPYVANLTRMIDTVTQSRGRAPQFAEGGLNASTASAAPPPGVDMSVMLNLTAALNALTAVLSGGVVAVLPDQTLTAMQGRMDKLNKASGGFFG